MSRKVWQFQPLGTEIYWAWPSWILPSDMIKFREKPGQYRETQQDSKSLNKRFSPWLRINFLTKKQLLQLPPVLGSYQKFCKRKREILQYIMRFYKQYTTTTARFCKLPHSSMKKYMGNKDIVVGNDSHYCVFVCTWILGFRILGILTPVLICCRRRPPAKANGQQRKAAVMVV